MMRLRRPTAPTAPYGRLWALHLRPHSALYAPYGHLWTTYGPLMAPPMAPRPPMLLMPPTAPCGPLRPPMSLVATYGLFIYGPLWPFVAASYLSALSLTTQVCTLGPGPSLGVFFEPQQANASLASHVSNPATRVESDPSL